MNTLKPLLFAVVAMLLGYSPCRAGVSAVCIVYQPIITASEAVTVETPKGFVILAVPFLCYHYQGHPPYYAITQPSPMLTDAPRAVLSDDSNLLSSAGVRIAGAFDDDTVYVRFEDLRHPRSIDEEVTDDDIAEAALECIRRLAHDTKNRPKLIISGKKGDEVKWMKWQKHFEQHDLTKPFNRPSAEAAGAEQSATVPVQKAK
jgi:hypothetical protein